MVQATYRSDQKHDLSKLRQTVVSTQPSIRRKKATQSRHDVNVNYPGPSTADCFHHVILYVDKKGRIQSDCSSTITHDERLKIVGTAMPEYREAIERIEADDFKRLSAVKTETAARTTYAGLQSQQAGIRRLPSSTIRARAAQSIKRPNKRPRPSSEDVSPYLQDDNSSYCTEPAYSAGTVENHSSLIGIEIQDSEKLKEYLFDAFTSFQQINCRTLCKSWIRMIEPKKQVNHPYNGNVKVKGLQKVPLNDLCAQKDSDPEETKPGWWPSKDDCPHKEPDHIKKEQRLALLCHILMNTRDLHECSTDDLKQAITSDRGKIKPIEKEAILQDVWKIGELIERFKDGQVDGTAMVYVTARKEEARMIRGGGRIRKPFDPTEGSEDEESGEELDGGPEEIESPTPTTPTPTPLASSLNYLNTESASSVSRALLDDCAYEQNPSAHHFPPPEIKPQYQDHQAEYTIPVAVGSNMGHISHQEAAEQVFNGDSFQVPESSFGDMQDLRSHVDLFTPEGQQIMGHWGISANPELYPMQYTGEPSQPPSINPADGGHIFGPYDYGGPHKQPYRNHVQGYSEDSHGVFAARYQDELTRYQRINSSSLPSHSTQRIHAANMMHQHFYDLPSHIRT